MTVFFVSPRIY